MLLLLRVINVIVVKRASSVINHSCPRNIFFLLCEILTLTEKK